MAQRSHLLHGLPSPLRNGAQIVAALLATYFWATFSGPYRWFADLQMGWLDGYYAIMTWILTLFVFLVPMGLVLQLFRRQGMFGDEADAARRAASADQWLARFNAGFARHRWPFMLAAGATGLLYFAGRGAYIAHQGSELERASLSTLEAGTLPEGSHLEIDGAVPAWDASIEWRDGHRTTVFVPVRSLDARDGKPVAVVLLFGKAEFEAAKTEARAFRGARIPEGVPTPVQVSFREAGFDMRDPIALSVGVDPRSMGSMETLRGVMALAGALLVVAALWFRKQRLAAR